MADRPEGEINVQNVTDGMKYLFFNWSSLWVMREKSFISFITQKLADEI